MTRSTRRRAAPGPASLAVALMTTAAFLAPLLATACASLQEAAEEPAAPEGQRQGRLADANLNAVLWAQGSVEYRATALQAYELAALKLEAALADDGWTAALEQSGEFSDLPPAVILDVDETVLDNSPYQARLILDDERFGSGSWGRWVEEAAAEPVPGALEFCRQAAGRGVTVFYVTNRDSSLEPATRRNLIRLGFPVESERDVLLTRGEKPEWDTSDKTPRREEVAEEYRILLLVGDNMGDFAAASEGSPEQRRAFAEENRSWWGTRWIVLPNPQYGSWEGAIIDFDYDLPRERLLRRKRQALDPRRQ